MSTRINTDMVLLPVELHLVSQVHDFLTGLRDGRPSPLEPAKEEEVSVHVPRQGRWTEALIAHLVEQTPYEGVLALLDRCASSPGRWVPKAEVEASEGISPVQLRNELGAFSKLTKKMFGGEKGTWPMEWKKERGAYLYRLDETIAQWWLDARSKA